jgi:hypothetical protein
MAYVFSQNKYHFDQCGHFSQVGPFEKPCFLIVASHNKLIYPLGSLLLDVVSVNFLIFLKIYIYFHILFPNIQNLIITN